MKFANKRGNTLIIVMILTITVMMMCGGVFNNALMALKFAKRSAVRTEARLVAESEMEYLFFRFNQNAMSGQGISSVDALVAAECDRSATPSTPRAAFLAAHRAANNGDGWIVRRSVSPDMVEIEGIIPGSTKYGRISYTTVYVEVSPPAGGLYANLPPVRIARRFEWANYTIFQYSIFFQGDLEIAPSTPTVISGDIATNRSAYIGAGLTGSLRIENQLRIPIGSYLNQYLDTKGTLTTDDDVLVDTIYNWDNTGNRGRTGQNPDFITKTPGNPTGTQLEFTQKKENLLGGIDAEGSARSRPDLFGPAGQTNPAAWTDAQLAEAANNVYRSLILPPPSAGSTDYPNVSGAVQDDPIISYGRVHNRAGIVVDVAAGGAVTISTRDSNGTKTPVPLNKLSAAQRAALVSTSTVYDQREERDVHTVNVDIEKLNEYLTGKPPVLSVGDIVLIPGTPPIDTLADNHNGVVYVNVAGATSDAPAAVRLKNAETVPASVGGDTPGFSLATNVGLYVQGDFNTTAPNGTLYANNEQPSAMLMADAVTVLSENWDDSNASNPDINSRVANKDLVINSSILTGNSITTDDNVSGGAQNLVRYLENWAGHNVTFNGSLACLFNSAVMTRPFQQPGTVYVPGPRNFFFNDQLTKRPPPGGPTINQFSRGNFFYW